MLNTACEIHSVTWLLSVVQKALQPSTDALVTGQSHRCTLLYLGVASIWDAILFYFSQSLERQCSLHLGPGGYMFCNNMFICSICQPKGERAWKDILNQGKTDGNMFCQQFTGKDMRCKSVQVWSDNRWIGNILENSFQDGPSQNFQDGPAQNPQTECMSQSLQENKNVWGYG